MKSCWALQETEHAIFKLKEDKGHLVDPLIFTDKETDTCGRKSFI